MAQHKNWEEVLTELKNYPKDADDFFMFTMNKDKSNEDRTRFFTYREAMVFVLYKIELGKTK